MEPGTGKKKQRNPNGAGREKKTAEPGTWNMEPGTGKKKQRNPNGAGRS
jgi:hypothetical protein